MWEKGADDEVFSRKSKPKTAAKCVLFLVFVVLLFLFSLHLLFSMLLLLRITAKGALRCGFYCFPLFVNESRV